jgi:hypothetical protein
MDYREKGFTHYVDLPDETILKYFLLKNLECLIPKLFKYVGNNFDAIQQKIKDIQTFSTEIAKQFRHTQQIERGT